MRFRHLSSYFCFLVIPLLSACAVHEDTFYRNQEINRRVFSQPPPSINGVVEIPVLGVAIDFRGTDGWSHVPSTGHGFRFEYAKYIDKARIHTAVIGAYPVFPPRRNFKDARDYFQYTKADLEKLRNTHGKDVEFLVTPDTTKAPMCVFFRRTTHTTKESHAPGRLFVIQGFEYVCKHPYRVSVFVNLHYSERYLYGTGDSRVAARARAALKRIRFVE